MTDKARPVADAAVSWLGDGVRSLPASPAVRVRVSKALLRRSRPIRVPLDKLLLGAQAGLPAAGVAELLGDPLWPSTLVMDGPHLALLRLAEERGLNLSDEEILASDYARLAQRCIEDRGSYFGATDAEAVVRLSRAFIGRYRGDVAEADDASSTYRSGDNDPILVAPVKASDCYQVLDGHHRLAVAAARGERDALVTVKRISTTTPLQNLLSRMSWLEGSRELYQPVDAPELQTSWPQVRRCTDRRDKMLSFLAERNLMPPASTSYLDVASCYGWFVDEMRKAGFDARGIERDPLGPQLGRIVYGLPEERISVGNAEKLLPQQPRTDVVSCFSLLHHFVLGRASVDAAELVRLLDQVTGSVLFLDTGQEHEAWFRESLAGWDTAQVAAFLKEHGTFDEVIDLGPDADAVAPYEENYSRHLFACVRAAQA